MILVAGGTGLLGRQAVARLTARGHDIRVLARNPNGAEERFRERVEVMAGNVRDPVAVDRAVAGADVVVSAVHGFVGKGDDNPRTVDRDGNSNLIRAAEAAGVGHFILISVQAAAPDHPMELHRMKYAAEQALRASALSWTIIRPTAFMELWLELLGKPLVTTGKTRIFGRGNNPINFVSVGDVAGFVELAVADPAMRGKIVEVGGPANLTMKQVIETVEVETGAHGAVSHVPRSMMRVMFVLMRPVNAGLARQIQSGVVMDTVDMTFNHEEAVRTYPSISPTSLREVVRRELGDGREATSGPTTMAPQPNPGSQR